MKTIVFLAIVSFLTIGGSQAQKLKLVEGDLKKLKGVKSLNTEFTYSPMVVGKDKDEPVYVEEKKAQMNEKEPGSGDKWALLWEEDRKNRFEPHFNTLFTKHSNGISNLDQSSPYKLTIRTTRTEPGFNVGVVRRGAFIDAEAVIVEAANPNNVIARIEITKSPGRDDFGFDFETGARLQDAYARAGQALGKFLADKTR